MPDFITGIGTVLVAIAGDDETRRSSRVVPFPHMEMRELQSPEDAALSRALNDLTAMLDDVNFEEEGYVFRLAPRAYRNAWDWLIKVKALMGARFVRPDIVSDGEGGVDIKWIRNGQIVMLVCRATPNQRDYIYYQEANDYDVLAITPVNLKERLDSLLSDEPAAA